MPSDPSNAHDALRDRADAPDGPQEPATSGSAPSSKAPQGRLLSEPPPGGDPEDDEHSLASELTVGSIVADKYRVDAVLGRGAMGVVVAATHVELDERVALKFLRYRAKGISAQDFQSRFRREARVSARLKNEHITRVIDVGVWRERVPYMVMDHLTGTDLREIIKTGGPLPVGTAVDYIVQVCTGIAEAHAHGIVHRDLKPSNLFVTKRPDGSDLVKILDFGISKWSAGESEVDELTQTGVVLGSPKYMSPEQLFGSSQVDGRADVWSIGAILYEMLCGRPPFDLPTFTKICAELATDRMPPSLHERRAEVPPELDAAVMRCFARDPAKRTQNVAELAGEVLDALGAPFATAVRQKIAAMLDARARDPASTSGAQSAMLSGTYSAIGLTGTGSSTGSGSRSQPASGSSHPGIPLSTAPAEGSRRSRVWVIAAALALAGGGYVLWRNAGHSSEMHAAGAALEAPGQGAPAAATSTASAAIPSAAEAATETATPPPTAATHTAAATEPPARTWHWHGRPSHGNGGSKTAQPATTASATAAATPTPTQPVATTPAPAPTPTQKVDPLGDRQ